MATIRKYDEDKYYILLSETKYLLPNGDDNGTATQVLSGSHWFKTREEAKKVLIKYNSVIKIGGE